MKRKLSASDVLALSSAIRDFNENETNARYYYNSHFYLNRSKECELHLSNVLKSVREKDADR